MPQVSVSDLFDQDELGRSSTNIEYDGRTIALFQQDMAAKHGQPRLFLRADDVQSDAGFAPHPLDEFGAILSPATGFRGD